MDYTLEDLIDISLLQNLQDKLNVVYSFPSAVIDTDGKVLTAVAWQDICTKFHRTNPQCEKECIKSDQYIFEHLHEANPAVNYQCPHGLIDNATPIVINGKHLGNFFTGQFFLEKPDLEFFKKQAKMYGFDEKAYLEAVEKVPIWTKEKLIQNLDFIKGFIEIIAAIGLNHLKEIEANKAIKESEDRNRAIIQSTSDWIWEIDEQGKYCYCSNGVERILGFTADEIIGKSPFDLMPPEESERVNAIFQNILEIKGSIVDLENWVIHKDGHKVCLLTNGFPIFNEAGKISGYRGADKDITERKQAEDALSAEEEKFHAIADYTVDWEVWIGIDGQIRWVNPSAERITGYSVSEVLVMPDFISTLVAAEDRDMCTAALQGALHGENIDNLELRYVHKNGSQFWMGLSGQPIFDTKGNSLGIRASGRDITERKRAEEALRESHQFNLQIVQSAREGIIVYGPDLRYLAWNPFMEQLSGKSAGEVLGKHPLEVFPFLKEAGVIDRLEKALAGETVDSVNFPYHIQSTGKSGWATDTCSQFRNAKGEIVGVVGIVNDITARKQFEQDLIIAKKHAEESDHQKSAFLANMSHEIRTPMNGILGFAELLKEPDLTGEEQHEYIRIIEKSGKRMLNIINDIVDISKIESGQMDISVSESNINEQIEFIYNFFKPEAERKRIQLSCKTTLPPKEAIIQTDREKIYAILTNLIKNAIKYTGEGSIEFGYILKTVSEPVELEFFVKDTGIGIPKNRQEAVFERFIQADIFDKQAFEGAGLGLSIARAYVEMLGGKIWVESEEGIGSTFYFTIPYNVKKHSKKAISNVVPPADEVSQIRIPKILIAEDEETSDFLITRMLKKISREVLHAKTGIEAVDACRNNPEIDLVLMDIRMPVMGGYEATRQIRGFNKDLIIIAQTAYGLSGDRQKSIDAGCNDYLSKPIDKEELVRLIQKHFKK